MEPLGQGGMATVWLARDLKHDRLVAIKLLRPELGVPAGAERFASEIGIVAKLNHPNILGVIDSGIVQVDGLTAPYYVMPHVEGPSLSALLARGERLPVNEALRLAAEVADALAFAHSRGIVHRDVKPGNILIQAGHALVADFGVAIALDAATVGGRHHTLAGQIMGTPVYMSPEQASGATRLDGRSDIYSLGCVLYEMLAGDPPFAGNTPQAMIVAHLSTPPPPLASKCPDLPHGVAATVHRALEKEPGDRYATAGDFRDTLEQLRTSIVVRRRWWPTAALVAAVAALFWWSPWQRKPATAPDLETVVLLTGFKDPSGKLRAEGAALDDALRLELQSVPGLRVVDVGGDAELPLDTLRQRYGADWVILGAVDQVGDSAGATVRVLDGSNGSEVRSAVVRTPSGRGLQSAASALGEGSLFGAVRYTMDSVLLNRWMLMLGTDPATAGLRQRARTILERSPDALVTAGPRRTFDELALADSLLAVAQAQSPSSALPSYERALLSERTAFLLVAARQFFPDSTWVSDPIPVLKQGVGYADAAIKRAPDAADTWFARARLYHLLWFLTSTPQWRDRSLGDVRHATALVGGRPDIWSLQASLENGSGRWKEALYSVEQGEATDHLHVYAAKLLATRWSAELALGRHDKALESCRKGSREFPDAGEFLVCEAEIQSRYSKNPADAGRVLELAESMSHDSAGPLGPFTPDELRLFAVAILARAGLSDSAARVYDRVIGSLSGVVVPIVLIDAAYARQTQGDLDSALALTARAVRLDSSVAPAVERNPGFEEMRRHPGYPSAIKGIAPSEATRR